jgi:hypothetical protein
MNSPPSKHEYLAYLECDANAVDCIRNDEYREWKGRGLQTVGYDLADRT